MILTVDVGNSNIVLGGVQGDQIAFEARLRTDATKTSDEYCIDLKMLLEVYGVTKQQFHDYLECEDIGMDVVKFKNGAVGTIEGTTNVYPKNLEETLYMFGETGTVKLQWLPQFTTFADREWKHAA